MTISAMWLFLKVPWVGMRYVIVVFPYFTHLFDCKKLFCNSAYHNIDIMQQSACLVVNPITVYRYGCCNILQYICNITRTSQRHYVTLITSVAKLRHFINYLSTIFTVLLNTLTKMTLSGPPGFTCWISFAPVFSLIYC